MMMVVMVMMMRRGERDLCVVRPLLYFYTFSLIIRVHDNVHDDMNMSLIMHDHSLFIGYDKHIIPHDQ